MPLNWSCSCNWPTPPGTAEAKTAASTAKASEYLRPRKERAPRIPENLPAVEQVIEPQEVIDEPGQWRLIGQEVSEQLDYEPAHFLRRRLIRKKYVHVSDPDRAPILAPLPDKLLERGLAGPGLLAHILVSKYCDHLPLYRQEQILAQRHKINLPRQTLANWVELCADWLQPIYEQIRTGVMAGGYAQVDETPVAYLAPGNGQTKQGYLWTACRPGGDVFYRWETSRAAECLERVVPREFKGVLQSDGFLRNGKVEIDNNLVENAIRPTAIGKKNWLFIGEAGAGQRGAIIYTLIESCRKRSIDPYAYLKDILTRLPSLKNTQIAEVTPSAWAKAARQKP